MLIGIGDGLSSVARMTRSRVVSSVGTPVAVEDGWSMTAVAAFAAVNSVTRVSSGMLSGPHCTVTGMTTVAASAARASVCRKSPEPGCRSSLAATASSVLVAVTGGRPAAG